MELKNVRNNFLERHWFWYFIWIVMSLLGIFFEIPSDGLIAFLFLYVILSWVIFSYPFFKELENKE